MDFKRKVTLIKLLYGRDKPVSSRTLSDKLGVTSRTLRNDLRSAADEFARNGFGVSSVHAVGYRLDVHDSAAFMAYVQELSRQEAGSQLLAPVYPEDRADYLVRLLLSADDYLKMDEVADELFVSRATLTGDLRLVRERLASFQLALESKPGYGLRVEGTELHRRSAIAQYFFHTTPGDAERLEAFSQNADEQSVIANLLYQTMLDKGFRLTDLGFRNLVVHIAIAVIRLRQGPVADGPAFDQSLLDSSEYEVAQEVCRRAGERLGVSFPQVEVAFVAMHLSGKRAMQYHQLEGTFDGLIDAVLADIDAAYGMDFAFDMSLRTALALHLEPMMARLTYGLVIQNPLLDQVKADNPLAFEMGVLLANHVRTERGLSMSDAEIGFVALHFALAIERFQTRGAKKNVIVICASGLGSSQILMYKIRHKFGEHIESILAAQLYDLPSINQEAYDFILSTVPVSFATRIPVIVIQYFLDDDDLAKVEEALLPAAPAQKDASLIGRFFRPDEFYTDIVGKERAAVLHEMIGRLRATRRLPEDFEDLVMQRERFAATEFGNDVAMPHPIKAVTDETFVAVAVLRRPILWERRQVRFVFLLSVSTDEHETFGLLHETLSALVFDKKALVRLARHPHFDELVVLLGKLSAEQEDLDELFG